MPEIDRCPHGHLKTPENTYTYPRGDTECRQCKRANKLRWQEQIRALKSVVPDRPWYA